MHRCAGVNLTAAINGHNIKRKLGRDSSFYGEREIMLETQEKGDVLVVHIEKRKILDSDVIEELKRLLFDLVEGSHRKIVVNMQIVEFLSSAMLNGLIVFDKKAKVAGIKWCFCQIKPEVYEVFVITRLYQLFVVKDNEAEAIGWVNR